METVQEAVKQGGRDRQTGGGTVKHRQTGGVFEGPSRLPVMGETWDRQTRFLGPSNTVKHRQTQQATVLWEIVINRQAHQAGDSDRQTPSNTVKHRQTGGCLKVPHDCPSWGKRGTVKHRQTPSNRGAGPSNRGAGPSNRGAGRPMAHIICFGCRFGRFSFRLPADVFG